MTEAIRVLHVDDDPAFTDHTAEFLERDAPDIDVTTETDAIAALEFVEEHDIDCIVADHEMAGMSGIELLEAVRKEYPDLPFVLFTGKGSEAVASEAISAGVTDYLRKERSTEQYELLANRIRNAVDHSRSRRTIERQKRRLETLIDNVPGITYRCENAPGWPMTEVEGECEAISGYAASALESGTVSWGDDLVHPADRETLWDAVQDAIDAGEPFEETYRIRTAGGTTKWVWERGRIVDDTNGATSMVEGFITDISAEKRRERRFEAIFNDPNLLVGLLDTDGTTLAVNETAIEYVDVPETAIVGRHFGDTPWWTDDQRSQVEQWLAAARDGEYVEYEATHPTDDDEMIVEGTFRPVTDDDGDVVRIVASAKDITERRQRERELKRRNEQFDRFASFVSHDLQSPISAVRGRLNLALETEELEHARKALEATERVDELRTDLVTTLRTGDIVADTEPIDLANVIDDVWTATDPPDPVSVTVADDVRIEADPDALQRLFENLVGNSVEHGSTSNRAEPGDAIEHGRDDVDIRVEAFEDGFAYEDDGPGIEPANRDRVFTPGFSTKNGEEGIGMGMASVRQITLAHGWTIRVRDAETLDGVRFEIQPEGAGE